VTAAEIAATNALLMSAERHTIVTYNCGCHSMLDGIRAVGDSEKCDDCGIRSVIAQATVVGIVDALRS
jgi:hypothetical protein